METSTPYVLEDLSNIDNVICLYPFSRPEMYDGVNFVFLLVSHCVFPLDLRNSRNTLPKVMVNLDEDIVRHRF